jgi:Uri superfamily endonuclease
MYDVPCCVYKYVMDASQTVFYVGQTTSSLYRRITDHANDPRFQVWFQKGKYHIEFLECNVAEATVFENAFIDAYRPPINVAMKFPETTQLIKPEALKDLKWQNYNEKKAEWEKIAANDSNKKKKIRRTFDPDDHLKSELAKRYETMGLSESEYTWYMMHSMWYRKNPTEEWIQYFKHEWEALERTAHAYINNHYSLPKRVEFTTDANSYREVNFPSISHTFGNFALYGVVSMRVDKNDQTLVHGDYHSLKYDGGPNLLYLMRLDQNCIFCWLQDIANGEQKTSDLAREVLSDMKMYNLQSIAIEPIAFESIQGKEHVLSEDEKLQSEEDLKS